MELQTVREELDDHLDTLNQNTTDINSLYEYLSELDVKMERLTERLDALQALLLAQTPVVKKQRLLPREEEVCSVLLSATEPLTSLEIGRRVGLTADVVAQTLFCLKQKGVEIVARVVEGETFYGVKERITVLS